MTATALPTAADTLEDLARAVQAFAYLIARGRMVETVLKASRIDLSRAEMQLLHGLNGAAGGIRLGDLADRLMVDAPTVTRRVQQLEVRQLVRRHSDPLDKRAQLVELTPAGTRLLDRAMEAHRLWVGRVLEEWSEADRVLLVTLLERFTNDLSAGVV